MTRPSFYRFSTYLERGPAFIQTKAEVWSNAPRLLSRVVVYHGAISGAFEARTALSDVDSVLAMDVYNKAVRDASESHFVDRDLETPTAVVRPTAMIEPQVRLGDSCLVGDRVVIGRWASIGNGVAIPDGSSIGRYATVFTRDIRGPFIVPANAMVARRASIRGTAVPIGDGRWAHLTAVVDGHVRWHGSGFAGGPSDMESSDLADAPLSWLAREGSLPDHVVAKLGRWIDRFLADSAERDGLACHAFGACHDARTRLAQLCARGADAYTWTDPRLLACAF